MTVPVTRTYSSDEILPMVYQISFANFLETLVENKANFYLFLMLWGKLFIAFMGMCFCSLLILNLSFMLLE